MIALFNNWDAGNWILGFGMLAVFVGFGAALLIWFIIQERRAEEVDKVGRIVAPSIAVFVMTMGCVFPFISNDEAKQRVQTEEFLDIIENHADDFAWESAEFDYVPGKRGKFVVARYSEQCTLYFDRASWFDGTNTILILEGWVQSGDMYEMSELGRRACENLGLITEKVDG